MSTAALFSELTPKPRRQPLAIRCRFDAPIHFTVPVLTRATPPIFDPALSSTRRTVALTLCGTGRYH